MNAPRCTATDSIDFLLATPRVVNATEAARVQPDWTDTALRPTLGRSPAAVAGLLHRAMQKLRAELSDLA